MTLVESAAFGAPSIVNAGGKVGATSLLGEGKGCIAIDFESALQSSDVGLQEIESILELLKSSVSVITLRDIAKEARSRALGWDEIACCQKLIDLLNIVR